MSVRVPLRNPVEPLGDAALARQRRTWLVRGIGEQGQARLAAARVLVIGAGGLGSPVLAYLAAAGVGTLGVCDSDVVELSNLQRQLLHGEADVGVPKPASAAARLGGLNSAVRVEQYPHATRAFLDEHGTCWDVVVDCTDSFTAKYLVADWAADAGVPLVWGTVVGTAFQLAVFWSQPPAGLPATSLRSLHPVVPGPGTTPTSSRVGVLGPVVGQAGTAMATEIIKLITGAGSPLIGQVLVGDAAQNRYQTLRYAH
ncbi:HesA/MoeB/ThiF family protein [Propionibacterium australiense]|uniref:HesA/MoeB/ThiF family protein n=1 Tax=Propionibacterium australiense TaxID=119981 RepID=A0A383S8A8_9ACTN|nr:HesA/MoeB/ThiF family protein [Propionibacterium australiense]RLP07607.1 HesA/MoeB/ThiF family protein [Propionibacterium australiense]RLP08383.1 HesA/MoeB/ThiF family protein [Propionibacterium australiense]SYZ33961.1 ThiF_MoeB_HesA_family [Propionibacterium australiense]VEH88938.1 Probable adenylyltransferase/sulfurtransferase MoeZ [Propionibacterium australiense]